MEQGEATFSVLSFNSSYDKLCFVCQEINPLFFSSVLVAYWEALLPTVATGCTKPLEWETIECVKCVLEKGV